MQTYYLCPFLLTLHEICHWWKICILAYCFVFWRNCSYFYLVIPLSAIDFDCPVFLCMIYLKIYCLFRSSCMCTQCRCTHAHLICTFLGNGHVKKTRYINSIRTIHKWPLLCCQIRVITKLPNSNNLTKGKSKLISTKVYKQTKSVNNRMRFELSMLVMIGTDCTDSC